MTQVVHCDTCGRKVGTREDLNMTLRKGCQVEIIITCAECLKPKSDYDAGKVLFEDIFGGLFGKGCNK